MKNWLILIAGAVLIAAVALSSNNYILRLATIMCMYATLAQSWNYIGGLTGYPSFATAAFFGLGAYTSGVLQNHGVPMVAAWGIAGLGAFLFAGFLGGAILHLRGHYFAIASLIVAEMLREIVNTMPDLTGGGMGLNLPILKISVDAQARLLATGKARSRLRQTILHLLKQAGLLEARHNDLFEVSLGPGEPVNAGAVSHVLEDRLRERIGLLEHHADAGAQFNDIQRRIVDVATGEHDRSGDAAAGDRVVHAIDAAQER